MSGFSFPPPPPPPPKASSSNGNNQNGQSGPPGRGRGRGRGRGGQENRGRGGRGGFASNQRNQQQYANNGGAFASNSSISNGLPARPNSSSAGQNSYGNKANPLSIPTELPPGAYINPAFQQRSSQNAMGISAGPASHQANVSNHHQSSNGAHNGPSRTTAGHKRKLEALRGYEGQHDEPAVPTALPIPSFGSPISVQEPVKQKPQNGSQVPPTRTTKSLGLTPAATDPQYSASESEDDADEEALFAQLGTTLKFEHNGEVMTIESAADLAAWKDERSKNFPTKDRIAAKMNEKRKLGDERRRLLEEASQVLQAVRDRRREIELGMQRKDQPPETELEKAKRELAEKTQSLAKLRKKVVVSEARLQAAKAEHEEATKPGARVEEDEAVDSGDPAEAQPSPLPKEEEPDDEMLEDEIDVEGSDRSSVVSEESSVVSSDSDDSDNDSDGPPEEVTSKAPTEETGTKKLQCKYFATSGSCKFGSACRFKHERLPGAFRPSRPANESNDRFSRKNQLDDLATAGKKSLFDQLVEKEQDEENRLALQVIKYLGKLEFFAEKTDGSE